MSELETPAPVVIDEALELARQFSGDESVSFINGVLDAVHKGDAAHQDDAVPEAVPETPHVGTPEQT
jgi:hypothetical protein